MFKNSRVAAFVYIPYIHTDRHIYIIYNLPSSLSRTAEHTLTCLYGWVEMKTKRTETNRNENDPGRESKPRDGSLFRRGRGGGSDVALLCFALPCRARGACLLAVDGRAREEGGRGEKKTYRDPPVHTSVHKQHDYAT